MCNTEKKGTIQIEITIREYFDNPQPEIEIIVDKTSIRVYSSSIEKALEEVESEIMKRLKK